MVTQLWPMRKRKHLNVIYRTVYAIGRLVQTADQLRFGVELDECIYKQVTFLTYISNACHSLLGVAERLQHTSMRLLCVTQRQRTVHFISLRLARATCPTKKVAPHHPISVSSTHMNSNDDEKNKKPLLHKCSAHWHKFNTNILVLWHHTLRSFMK